MVLSPSVPTQGPPPWWQQRTSECSRTGFFGYQWWVVWRGEEEERDPRGAPAAHQKEHPTCGCSLPLASQPVTERRKREGVCGAVGGSNKLRDGPEVSCSCLFTHFIIIIVITIFSCGLSSSWCCSDEVCPPFPSAGVFTHPQMFHTSSSHARPESDPVCTLTWALSPCCRLCTTAITIVTRTLVVSPGVHWTRLSLCPPHQGLCERQTCFTKTSQRGCGCVCHSHH